MNEQDQKAFREAVDKWHTNSGGKDLAEFMFKAALAHARSGEPTAWLLECQLMGGDTGWELSRSKSGAGVCHRLEGEAHEKPLFTYSQPDFKDAYQGARDDLEIWKKRALEAEALNKRFMENINGPTYMGEPVQAPLINEPSPGFKKPLGVSRWAGDLAKTGLMVWFKEEPTDDEMRNFHNALSSLFKASLSASHSQPVHAQPSISSMVDRFLGWKLPMDFAPDGGISIDTVVAGRNGWPTGTNLFNAKQATELFAYVLGEIDTQPNKAPDHSEQPLEKVQLKRLSRYETAALAEQYPDDLEAYANAVMDSMQAITRDSSFGAEKSGYWLIYFEDKMVAPEIFTERSAAIERYHQVSDSYNAHLFERIQGLSSQQPSIQINEELLWAAKNVLDNDGADGSKCYSATKLYDARNQLKNAIKAAESAIKAAEAARGQRQ